MNVTTYRFDAENGSAWKARLHRAFPVFLFNSKGELMLQQRALHKYHSQVMDQHLL